MKFVIVNEVDGVNEFKVVEAENAIEALNEDWDVTDILSGKNQGKEVATVGIYEVGNFNHLVTINNDMHIRSWANSRIEELKSEIEALKNESK